MNNKKWRVALVGVFAGIALALVQNKVSPCITIIMSYFNIDMKTAGLLSSIFAIMGIVTALPAALILQKLGPKRAGLISLLFSIVGSIIGITTNNIHILIASRVIEGFGVGIIAVTAPSLISMWFPPEKRGFPMGIWGAWMIVSQSVLFVVSGPLTLHFGWKGMWGFGLAVCIVAALLYMLVVESPPKDQNYANVEGAGVSIKEGLMSRSSWMLAIAAACFTFASFGFVSWIGSYWMSVTGWPLNKTNNWISLLYTVEIGYAVLVGFILDRVKDRKRMAVVGFIFYAFLLWSAFNVGTPALIIALVFIYPMFDALIPCVSWAIGPQTAIRPELAGVALGVLNIGLNFGTLFSAPSIGWVIQTYGAGYGGVALAVSALLGMFFMSRVKLYSGKNV